MLKIYLSQNTKVAVVGDIHEHEEQFNSLLDIISPSENMILVSVGDIYHRGMGPVAAESILNKIKKLQEKNIGFMVKGNHELKELRKIKKQNNMNELSTWLNHQPLSINFNFSDKFNLTVLHGGVTPNCSWKDLDNVNICFVRSVDENGKHIQLKRIKNPDGSICFKQDKPGTNWHELYDGRFGYIASGHQAQLDGEAKFYKNSCNLDSGCYTTGVLSCQIFSENGLEQLIKINGNSYYADTSVYEF